MHRAILAGLVLAGLFSGCTKDKTTFNCVYQSCPAISFNAQVYPLVNLYCNSAGCHNAASHKGGLTLDSTVAYSQLTQAGAGYITPGQPYLSIVYNQFQQGIMPPSGYPFPTDCEIQEFYCWIEQGAPNN